MFRLQNEGSICKNISYKERTSVMLDNRQMWRFWLQYTLVNTTLEFSNFKNVAWDSSLIHLLVQILVERFEYTAWTIYDIIDSPHCMLGEVTIFKYLLTIIPP